MIDTEVLQNQLWRWLPVAVVLIATFVFPIIGLAAGIVYLIIEFYKPADWPVRIALIALTLVAFILVMALVR